MTNPYESPSTVGSEQKRDVPVYLRVLAVLFWLTAALPATLVAVAMAMHPPQPDLSKPVVWLDFGFGITTMCLLPLIGFGLLGCGAWRRSARLMVVGVAVLIAAVLLVCLHFLIAGPET